MNISKASALSLRAGTRRVATFPVPWSGGWMFNRFLLPRPPLPPYTLSYLENRARACFSIDCITHAGCSTTSVIRDAPHAATPTSMHSLTLLWAKPRFALMRDFNLKALHLQTCPECSLGLAAGWFFFWGVFGTFSRETGLGVPVQDVQLICSCFVS